LLIIALKIAVTLTIHHPFFNSFENVDETGFSIRG